MSKREGEVREVPFLRNDMKMKEPPTTGKPLDKADAPGRADSELVEDKDPKGNVTVNVDDAQLDETTANKR